MKRGFVRCCLGVAKGKGACSCLVVSKEMQEPTDALAGRSTCTHARFVAVSAEEHDVFSDVVCRTRRFCSLAHRLVTGECLDGTPVFAVAGESIEEAG